MAAIGNKQEIFSNKNYSLSNALVCIFIKKEIKFRYVNFQQVTGLYLKLQRRKHSREGDATLSSVTFLVFSRVRHLRGTIFFSPNNYFRGMQQVENEKKKIKKTKLNQVKPLFKDQFTRCTSKNIRFSHGSFFKSISSISKIIHVVNL